MPTPIRRFLSRDYLKIMQSFDILLFTQKVFYKITSLLNIFFKTDAIDRLNHRMLINLNRRKLAYSDTSSICLIVNSSCNLKCPMCYAPYIEKQGSRRLSFSNFVKIIDKLPKLKSIEFEEKGDDLLRADFFRMMEYVKKKGIWIDLCLNLTVFSEEILDKILELKIDTVWISFNSLKKDVFEKLKKGAIFERVRSNLEYLTKKRSDKGCDKPFIHILSILTTLNIGEIKDLIDYADSIEAGAITFTSIKRRTLNTDAVKFYEEFNVPLHVIIDEMSGLKDRINSKKIKVYHDSEMIPDLCVSAWSKNLSINWDGNVWPLCVHTHGFQDFSHPFGNILSQEPEDILNSIEFKKLKKSIARRKLTKFCEAGFCQNRHYNKK